MPKTNKHTPSRTPRHTTKPTPKKTPHRSSPNLKSSKSPAKRQSNKQASGQSSRKPKSTTPRHPKTKLRHKSISLTKFSRSKLMRAKILSVAKNSSLLLGLILTSTWGLHQYWYRQSLTFDQNLIAIHAPVSLPNLPTHIHIPWKVDVDIEPSVYHKGSWTISPDKASFVINSALPGESGNIIIFGHNQRSIVGNIRALTGNETITLTLRDNSKRLYRVASIHQVSPTNTSFLKPTETETLTIYTCAGLFDRDRFIAVAYPVEPLASSQQP